MKEFELKYGCNPNQKPARIFMDGGGELPIEILNGMPGYINFLDALNSWQLVKEIKEATGRDSATSFKHVSPTSAAIGNPLTEDMKKAFFVNDIDGLEESDLALAYSRARASDRMSSFGDFVALSGECDEVVARILAREVSDGIIAPSFTKEALEILKKKKKGRYNIIKIDRDYIPRVFERKDVFGVIFEQGRNDSKITEDCLRNIVTENKNISKNIISDMIISLITLKYTQSNSVAFAYDGQTVGVGAGQQSRIHCTRLAASKADIWTLRQSQQVLELPFKEELGRPTRDNIIDAYLGDEQEELLENGLWQEFFTCKPNAFTKEKQREVLSKATGRTVASDAFFPFDDNIKRAYRSGANYVVQPGGSMRDDVVIDTCNKLGMVCAFTGMRLFHH